MIRDEVQVLNDFMSCICVPSMGKVIVIGEAQAYKNYLPLMQILFKYRSKLEKKVTFTGS